MARFLPASRRGRYAMSVGLLVAGLVLAVTSDLTTAWGPLTWGVSMVVTGAGVVLAVETVRAARREGLGDVIDWSAPQDPGLGAPDDQTTR